MPLSADPLSYAGRPDMPIGQALQFGLGHDGGSAHSCRESRARSWSAARVPWVVDPLRTAAFIRGSPAVP
jgi:hypothetical protein